MSSAYHHIGEHRYRQRIGLDTESMRQDHFVEALLLLEALADCDSPESSLAVLRASARIAGRSIGPQSRVGSIAKQEF